MIPSCFNVIFFRCFCLVWSAKDGLQEFCDAMTVSVFRKNAVLPSSCYAHFFRVVTGKVVYDIRYLVRVAKRYGHCQFRGEKIQARSCIQKGESARAPDVKMALIESMGEKKTCCDERIAGSVVNGREPGIIIHHSSDINL